MAFPVDWKHPVASSEYASRPQSLKSRGGDIYMINHHAYNLLVQHTLALADAGGKQVTMTWAIGPTIIGGNVYCVGVVEEQFRPFTTASFMDAYAVTTEVSNLDLNAPYPVAQQAKEKLAQIAAYLHIEYGMPLNRWHVTCHAEAHERGWGSYPTACPGPDLRAALDWVVQRAKDIVNGATSPITQKEDDMQIITNDKGVQLFVDEFGADDIGTYFFTPNGRDKSPSWGDNVAAAQLIAGKPLPTQPGWQFDLARHIAQARWRQKKGEIVTDVTKALTPFLEQLAGAVSGLNPESVREAIEEGLANVVVETPPLSAEDAEAIARLTREKFREDPLS